MNNKLSHTPTCTPQGTQEKLEPVRDRPAGGPPPSRPNHVHPKPSARALMEIMREELSLYVELFNIKRQERPCLAAGAVTELQKITDDLQVVVDKIKRAEKSRAEEMDRWAKVVGCGPSHVTLRMIAQQVSPEEGQTLIEVGDQLKALVITVRDENNVNQLLLRRSLRLANDEIRILINSEEESGAYSAQGSVSPQRTPCGRRLVDCRA